MAGKLVDLDHHHNHALGEVLANKTGDQVYFSLGNGRAIKIALPGISKNEGMMLKNFVLNKVGSVTKLRPIKRRNLKW